MCNDLPSSLTTMSSGVKGRGTSKASSISLGPPLVPFLNTGLSIGKGGAAGCSNSGGGLCATLGLEASGGGGAGQDACCFEAGGVG